MHYYMHTEHAPLPVNMCYHLYDQYCMWSMLVLCGCNNYMSNIASGSFCTPWSGTYNAPILDDTASHTVPVIHLCMYNTLDPVVSHTTCTYTAPTASPSSSPLRCQPRSCPACQAGAQHPHSRELNQLQCSKRVLTHYLTTAYVHAHDGFTPSHNHFYIRILQLKATVTTAGCVCMYSQTIYISNVDCLDQVS